MAEDDNRTPEQILIDVVNEAKIAFNAEVGFLEWRADHQGQRAFFGEWNRRYLEWIALGEPYARSY